MTHSNHLAEVTRHFQEPIERMIETGIFIEPMYMIGGVPGVTIRKVARRVCGELKRPFIYMEEIRDYWMTTPGHSMVRNPNPPWLYTFISIPKQKRTFPIASPLLLATSGQDSVRRWSKSTPHPVEQVEFATKWAFRISDRAFLDEYLQTVFTDPDIRRAIGVDPK